MTWRQLAHTVNLPIAPEVGYAFDLLERDGLKFCVHFGTLTAIGMATDRWLDKLDREMSQR